MGLGLGTHHLEVVGGEAHRDARAVALHRVHQGLAQLEQERVAELVGLDLVGAVAARPPPLERVAAEAIALEVSEDVAQGLVADLADGPRGQLEPVAFPLEIAGFLQLLGHLAQALEVAGRLLAQELLDLLRVDLLEVVGIAHLLDLPLELVELAELVHQLHGLLHREVVVAAEVVALAVGRRHELAQVHAELAQLGLEPLVLHEERLHHVLELAALAGRHAREQRLHLAGLLGDLLHELVEVLGAREVVAPLLLEGVEVRLAPLRAVLEHAVEVAHHLPHPLEVLGAHVAERLLHVGEERLQHLLLQALHQLPEQAVRVGVHELVVLQALDARGRGLRHLVERLLVLGGRLLHRLPERLGRLAALRPLLGVAHPPLDALALGLEDLVELLLDVVEHRGEIVTVELLLALPAQAVEQVLKPGEVGPVRVLRAALEEAPQRAPRIAVRQEVVGHGVEELIGVEIVEALGAVPARVPDRRRH